jgi:hypothetical protein
MKKRLITIALSIALALTSTTSYAKEAVQQQPTQLNKAEKNITYTDFPEGTVVTLEMPAYAKGSGKVYRDKTVIQDLSYQKIDSGDCYTYIFTRELKMSKKDVKAIGSDAAISCQFGSFDRYSGNTIIFGLHPDTDIISAEDSGVGVPVYLADVEVNGEVYTLSSYQLETTAFTLGKDKYYHSVTTEVVNVPKDYDGYALVTYGLTDEEHEKAQHYDEYNQKNGYLANIYTQLSTYIDPTHIAYYALP